MNHYHKPDHASSEISDRRKNNSNQQSNQTTDVVKVLLKNLAISDDDKDEKSMNEKIEDKDDSNLTVPKYDSDKDKLPKGITNATSKF